MKKLSLLILVLISLCFQENTGIKGFFVNISKTEPFFMYNSITDYREFPAYFRFSGDTIVIFQINNHQIDSSMFVWNKKINQYLNYTNPGESPSVTLGNRKYIVINKNLVTFDAEVPNKSKPKNDKDWVTLEELRNDFLRVWLKNQKDTLQRVSKDFVLNGLKRDFTFDSIIEYVPKVEEKFVRKHLSKIFSNHVKSNQEILENTIHIIRHSDDKFSLNFLTEENHSVEVYEIFIDFDRYRFHTKRIQ